MDDEAAVVVEGLTFTYSDAPAPALRDINLSLERGRITLLIGATAAGKSTLYLALSGLIPHVVHGTMSGRVIVEGMDTAETSVPDLAQRVGIVFQDPDVQLFSLSVEDELAFGPENLGLPVDEIWRRVRETTAVIGLADLLDREPARLSGGQQQSVAIGAVWAMLPDVLILDEPTSNLDPQNTERVLELVRRLNTEYGKTVLLAEHKIDEVAALADRVLVMSEGAVVLDGPPREVFAKVDELAELGLRPPVSAEVAHRLRTAGLALEEWPLTVEEGVDVLARLLHRRAPA